MIKHTAEIHWPDTTITITTAYRQKGFWIVGGDRANATTDLGGKIYIIKDGKIFWLKGSRMIFQDQDDSNG